LKLTGQAQVLPPGTLTHVPLFMHEFCKQKSFAQLAPPNPSAQAQVRSPGTLTHVPLFMHGFTAQ
jgi:hypothetical protein